MRIIIIFVLIIIPFLYSSCKEESIGQYPVDDVAPRPVTNVNVQNIKGGAVISYTLPDDKDLLYVKAVYSLPNGERKERKTSVYNNSIIIQGFAKSTVATVQLISVDRSQNESSPVNVEINPDDSPIFDVFSTLEVLASFGGIKLTWENKDRADVVIGILSKNEENNFVPIENFYTSVEDGIGTVRGLSSTMHEFGIYVRDIYNNHTDTLFIELTPWQEFELDKALWREVTLCPLFSLYSSAGVMSRLWDGVTKASKGNQNYYLQQTGNEKIFFTFDLGVTVKLSRFKFWGRDQWYFNLHNPKEFEIWGTDNASIAYGDPCSWEGWDLLLSGTSTKPSGEEVLPYNQLTSEDIAYAEAGEEYEFPEEAPYVRFIRFKTLSTWTGSQNFHIAELSFWGDFIE